MKGLSEVEMACINISEIFPDVESSEWLVFRESLTKLDVEVARSYSDCRCGYLRIHSQDVLGVGRGDSIGLHEIRGFLPSSVISRGLFRPRMENPSGNPECSVLLTSGLPHSAYRSDYVGKWSVSNRGVSLAVIADVWDRAILLPCRYVSDGVTVASLCAVLKGTGVCSMPAGLFYVYTGACLDGMGYLYPTGFSQSLNCSGWEKLPVEITPERVMHVRGLHGTDEFSDLLGFVAKAVNRTLQDRKTVRELAVKYGIIGRV